jgi:hypothetical protein
MSDVRRYEPGPTVEFAHEEHLFVLNGRVLEHFYGAAVWESRRIHVSRLAVYVEPPDRKGRTEFRFQPLDVATHGVKVKLPPEQVEPMRRFVAAMTAARDAADTPP